MVEPTEYLLSAKEQRMLQYVPILKSLHEILKKKGDPGFALTQL